MDTFCCAGGVGFGYYQAGFIPVGVDIEQQDNYPFLFVQMDAIEAIEQFVDCFDAIHASPPCQEYSVTKTLHDNKYPDLLVPTRNALKASGKPYIMENVPGSPMLDYVKLRGDMFGLRTLRVRYFESNCLLIVPSYPKKKGTTSGNGKKYSSFDDGYYVTVTGNNFRFTDGKVAMDIFWMTKRELTQSIPPAYSEFLGLQLMRYVNYESLEQAG
jgi:DNA (cytosine-5)-methyltransferase 1